jgi:hypothetical protein
MLITMLKFGPIYMQIARSDITRKGI